MPKKKGGGEGEGGTMNNPVTNRLLEMILAEEIEQTSLLHCLLAEAKVGISLLQSIVSVLQSVDSKLTPLPVASFTIWQLSSQGGTVAIKGVAPGGSGLFTATPVDTNGNPATLPSGVIPSWTSSDPANAPVTPGADGLSASVAVAAGATPGGSFTLTVQATLPDGSTPSGQANVPILTVTVPVASFVIDQTQ